jgi:hypothetical protein
LLTDGRLDANDAVGGGWYRGVRVNARIISSKKTRALFLPKK